MVTPSAVVRGMKLFAAHLCSEKKIDAGLILVSNPITVSTLGMDLDAPRLKLLAQCADGDLQVCDDGKVG